MLAEDDAVSDFDADSPGDFVVEVSRNRFRLLSSDDDECFVQSISDHGAIEGEDADSSPEFGKFGDDFSEQKIYRIRFTDLIDWILSIPNFEGKKEECNEGHLEQIQAKWVYEWRDNQ